MTEILIFGSTPSFNDGKTTTLSFPASRVSSFDLKKFLEANHQGNYSVQVCQAFEYQQMVMFSGSQNNHKIVTPR